MKKTAKTIIFAGIALALLISCTPVLKRDLLDSGIRDISFPVLLKDPELFQGKLFILGGEIANTTITARGSVVEALYIPVDSYGFLEVVKIPGPRYLAIYPKDLGILDPVIYKQHREITMAGIFTGTETGQLDEIEYIYPVFRIEQIFLWEPLRPYPGSMIMWGYPHRPARYPYGRYRLYSW